MEGKELKGKGARKSAAREIAYIAFSVALITVCAWVSIPIGPIPFTLQTFAIALIGALMGWRSLAAVFVYVLMGLIGIPVFSGFRAGVGALFGPTGGYIFGFFLEALIPALFKIIPVKNKWARTGVFYAADLLGLAALYLFGTVWFLAVYRCTLGYALALCVVPYLLPDAVKVALAAALSVRLERFVK